VVAGTLNRYAGPVPRALRLQLPRAWSAGTSAEPTNWTPGNAAWGQCAVTALVVQDALGGVLVRADVDGVAHYWNRLDDGREVDLTREQFGPDADIPAGEERDRSYVLSFSDTARRYKLLKRRLRNVRSCLAS
jgi:hypothetical protein